MPKSLKRAIKVRLQRPRLDKDEFNHLTDILFELNKENHSKCAKLLGIGITTWKRWETQPPTWPYWNIVLRHVLKSAIPQIAGNRGLTEKHRQKLITALTQLPKDDPLTDYIEDQAYRVAGSVTHLRSLLLAKGMYKDEIFVTAKMGGFSQKTLENAARTLGIVKTQEGFGKHKRSYWRLPNEDDE
jgi:hypothetical protein